MSRRGPRSRKSKTPERIQTGVRLERNVVKVLKAVAADHEMSLGELLEAIVVHAFEGRNLFDRDALRRIRAFTRLYGLRPWMRGEK